MRDDIAGKFRANNLCVAVSGKSGCGNTTTSGLLAKQIGVDLINYTFRSLASERGVSLDEIIAEARRNDEVDLIVDKRQVEMANKQSCVLASRLAIWMKKDAYLKVYLYADADIRATRVHNREGGDSGQIVEHTKMRDASDHERYLELYGIDNDNYDFADLVLDAGKNTPEELVSIILEELESRLGLI